MLHSINEREEGAQVDKGEEEEEEKRDESPIIGHADKREIVKVFQNCHKNLKQFQIGADSQSDFILSDKKLDMRKISRKISKLSSASQNN
jgi:hypothetical protein